MSDGREPLVVVRLNRFEGFVAPVKPRLAAACGGDAADARSGVLLSSRAPSLAASGRQRNSMQRDEFRPRRAHLFGDAYRVRRMHPHDRHPRSFSRARRSVTLGMIAIQEGFPVRGAA
jgi:hypothetical protein